MLEPARVIELFNTSKDIQTYRAGDTIFNIGEIGEVMYGIIEGEVDMMLKGDVFETIKKGDVFGEGALVQNPPVSATTAVAKTDCKLAAVDKAHFQFLVQETPLFALEVIRSMSTRLRAVKAAY